MPNMNMARKHTRALTQKSEAGRALSERALFHALDNKLPGKGECRALIQAIDPAHHVRVVKARPIKHPLKTYGDGTRRNTRGLIGCWNVRSFEDRLIKVAR